MTKNKQPSLKGKVPDRADGCRASDLKIKNQALIFHLFADDFINLHTNTFKVCVNIVV